MQKDTRAEALIQQDIVEVGAQTQKDIVGVQILRDTVEVQTPKDMEVKAQTPKDLEVEVQIQ